MSDKDFEILAEARLKKEEIEFEKWFSEMWGHILAEEKITADLAKFISEKAWEARSIR